MTEEFNLSERILLNKEGSLTNVLNQDYVEKTLKEFIRLLKEVFVKDPTKNGLGYESGDGVGNANAIINKLAGEKLI